MWPGISPNLPCKKHYIPKPHTKKPKPIWRFMTQENAKQNALRLPLVYFPCKQILRGLRLLRRTASSLAPKTANIFQKMPGRVPTRASTMSRISRKSSTQTLNSRTSTTSPTVVIPEEGPESTLRTQICSIFGDAQRTTTGHRTLVVSLRKLQESCCYEPIKPSKKGRDEFNEDDFNVEIARCVIRLMGVKKSEGVGDRIVRFLGFFLRHASEKGSEGLIYIGVFMS